MPIRTQSSLSALVARDLVLSYGDRVVLDGVDLPDLRSPCDDVVLRL